ncbi:Carboxyl-terminal-processing peptidase 3, chloroplastic [Linum perenne]
MVEMFPTSSSDVAYNKISGMLSTVRDPFTQIISPKEYQSFRIGSDGNLQGLGVFINLESKIGHLLPSFLDWFGWCTWDAFYTDVTTEGVEQGLSRNTRVLESEVMGICKDWECSSTWNRKLAI